MVPQNIFVGSVTGCCSYYLNGQAHSPHFDLSVDALAQTLKEVRQFQILTYFSTSWPSHLTFDFDKLQADVWIHSSYVGRD